MASVIISGLFTSLLAALSAVLIKDRKTLGTGVVCAIFATCFFVVSMLFAAYNRNGLPITKQLTPGVYKIGFFYQAGDNVSIGIEKKEGNKENLYFYMFPREFFEGAACFYEGSACPDNPKLLRVVDDGSGYNKLKLEPSRP